MTKTYVVTWEMDIEAETPEAAAAKALEIHRDPESIATMFDVHDMTTGEGFREDMDPFA